MNKFAHRWLSIMVIVVSFLGSQSQAATEDNFLAKNTQDIIELCSAKPSEPLYTKAIHFCHGYLVGAFHFQEALFSGTGYSPVVCLAKPKPTRNTLIMQYIDWVKTKPEYFTERTVDTMMEFLVENYPCKD